MKRQLEGHLEAERHARDSLVLSLLVAVCIALLLIWKLAPEQTTKATVQSTPSPIPKATTQPTPAKTPDLKAVTPLVKPNDRIWRLKEDHFEELGSYALSYFWRNPPTIAILRPDSTYEVLTCDDFYGPTATLIAVLPTLLVGIATLILSSRIARISADLSRASSGIAYQQLETAKNKLRHDLFDRRFAAFEAADEVSLNRSHKRRRPRRSGTRVFDRNQGCGIPLQPRGGRLLRSLGKGICQCTGRRNDAGDLASR